MVGATTLAVLTAIGLAVFAVAFYFEYTRFRREGPHLTVAEFRIDRASDAVAPVRVSGRPAGLRGWLSSQFNGEGSYVFRASRVDITLEHSSPAGVGASFLPLCHVASTRCDYRQPHALLTAAFFLCVLGLVEVVLVWASGGADDYRRRLDYEALSTNLVVCLVLAMVSYAFFQAGKRILIDIESRGGRHLGFSFKRGFAGGAPVDFDRALDLMEVLNNLVLTGASDRSREVAVGTV